MHVTGPWKSPDIVKLNNPPAAAAAAAAQDRNNDKKGTQ
jgi:hypothetical protein